MLTTLKTSLKGSLILTILFQGVLFGQSGPELRITGSVQGENNESIELVNVFISNTTIGTSTGNDGMFEFTSRITGQYDLVFSRIGYESKTVPIDLSSAQRVYEFHVTLTESTFELDEISVTADNREWQRMYDEFRREFLGGSLFARDTEIENPWVLDFERDRNRNLVATAREPLEIVNMALGYRIFAEVNDFSWDREVEAGFFTMNVKFEELEASTPAMAERWEENRRRAYRGSFEHFLHSLYENRLTRNQFQVVRPSSTSGVRVVELNQEDLILHLINRGNFDADRLNELRGFQVRRGGVDVLIGERSYRTDERDIAHLVPRSQDGVFILTQERTLYDPLDVAVGGEWARYRLADKLPVDYYFE